MSFGALRVTNYGSTGYTRLPDEEVPEQKQSIGKAVARAVVTAVFDAIATLQRKVGIGKQRLGSLNQ